MIEHPTIPTMRIRHLLFVPFALLAAACGESHDALAGYWKAQAPVDGLQVGLEFDGKGGKVIVHLDGPDGHSHPPSGTYTLDAGTKAVTVRAFVLGEGAGKPDTWTGSLDGELLTLAAGATKLTLKKGGSAH